MLNFIILSMAVSVISLTLTKSRLFLPVRFWFGSKGNRLVSDFITCPYCLSHWVAIVLVVAYKVRLVSLWLPIDYLITAFAVVCIASILSGVILYLIPMNSDADKYRTLLAEAKQVIKERRKR